MNWSKTKTSKITEMFDIDRHDFGFSPESRLWAAVLYKMFEDVKYSREGVLKFYSDLLDLADDPNFYSNKQAHEMFTHLITWEHERQKLMHELQSEWVQEICDMIDFDYSRFKKKVFTVIDISHNITGQITYWKTGFDSKKSPITNEVIKNGIKRKKEEIVWETA